MGDEKCALLIDMLRPDAAFMEIVRVTCMHQPQAFLEVYPACLMWNRQQFFEPCMEQMPDIHG